MWGSAPADSSYVAVAEVGDATVNGE